MIEIKYARIDPRQFNEDARTWRRGRDKSDVLTQRVRAIISSVRREGDAALVRLTRELDHRDVSRSDLRVTRSQIEAAYEHVSPEQVEALKTARRRLERVANATLETLRLSLDIDGTHIQMHTRPISEIGCYVPGGEADYPSTVMMCAVPARVAGVSRLVVCTPPRELKSAALTLVACDISGVDEVFMVGGAQAIAALAYGTESIRPVDKIVGPGNAYVTLAKKLVSGDVAIDMPAGPSELIVIADDSADPRLIALDMISQAEHSADAMSVLITDSPILARRTLDELEMRLGTVSRENTVRESLRRNGAIYVCDNIEDCVRLSDLIAPEHLEIITRSPHRVRDMVKNAGLILLGAFTPVAASDYAIGVNHVLPTSGHAAVFSGLSVLDFIRSVYSVECSEDGLRQLEQSVIELARAERLDNHAVAVQGRFRN
ncbi:MAG: histidinol dehydrogenase [Candidatus Thorarchaeota archaeon]